MTTPRCPGQDRRFWRPKDIFEVRCPYCDKEIEFWKDESFRYCSGCGERVNNPRIDLSCAKWCQYAKECLGTLPEDMVVTVPVVERLIALLTKRLPEQPWRMKHAREVHSLAEKLMANEEGEPHVIKTAALLLGALMAENADISNVFSPEETPFYDFYSRKTILEQAGIEFSTADEICALIEAVISGNPQESPEYDVLWDVVQLERLFLIHDSGKLSIDPGTIIHTIKTQSGTRMVERYLRPNSEEP